MIKLPMFINVWRKHNVLRLEIIEGHRNSSDVVRKYLSEEVTCKPTWKHERELAMGYVCGLRSRSWLWCYSTFQAEGTIYAKVPGGKELVIVKEQKSTPEAGTLWVRLSVIW